MGGEKNFNALAIVYNGFIQYQPYLNMSVILSHLSLVITWAEFYFILMDTRLISAHVFH